MNNMDHKEILRLMLDVTSTATIHKMKADAVDKLRVLRQERKPTAEILGGIAFFEHAIPACDDELTKRDENATHKEEPTMSPRLVDLSAFFKGETTLAELLKDTPDHMKALDEAFAQNAAKQREKAGIKAIDAKLTSPEIRVLMSMLKEHGAHTGGDNCQSCIIMAKLWDLYLTSTS